jgi:thiol-disulfide isomerase/thioredoxin
MKGTRTKVWPAFSFLGFVFILGLALGAGANLPAQSSNAGEISPGVRAAFEKAGLPLLRRPAAAPQFSLPLLNGGTVSNEGLKGKVVFLNFWATWCPPCREEMPSLEALFRRLSPQGLEFLAVDIQESREQAAAYLREGGFSFPAALDLNGQVSRRYGVRAIPTSFIIDRNGAVIARITGALDWNRPGVAAALEALLNDGR